MDFAVRSFAPSDRPFVEASWIRGSHAAPSSKRLPSPLWASAMGPRVARCLGEGSTLVAADISDLATLVGWVSAARAGDDLVVHWIYVPRMLRRSGLGTELLAAAAVELGLPGVRRIVATQESKHDGWLREVARRRGLELAFDPLGRAAA